MYVFTYVCKSTFTLFTLLWRHGGTSFSTHSVECRFSTVLTLSFRVDLEAGGRAGRLADSVFRHALEDAVVSSRLGGLDAQHSDSALLDGNDRVPLVIRRHTSSFTPPEHVRGRVTRRSAVERYRSVFLHLLILRRHGDLGRIYTRYHISDRLLPEQDVLKLRRGRCIVAENAVAPSSE